MKKKIRLHHFSSHTGENRYPVTLFSIALFAFVALPKSVAFSQESGFAFLNAGSGARVAGLGGSGAALADNAAAIYFNPAGLASKFRHSGVGRNPDNKELSLTHSEWLLGSSLDSIALAFPSPFHHSNNSNKPTSSFGLGVLALTQPAQDGRDSQGRKTGNFKAQDLSFSLAYAASFTRRIGLGLGLKMIQSRIADEKAQGLAVDLGALWNPSLARHPGASRGPDSPFRHSRESGNPDPLSIGFTVRNLGPSLTFIEESTRLPLTLSLGGAWAHSSGFTLACDISRRVYDKKTNLSLGAEYALGSLFTFRSGYAFDSYSRHSREGGNPGPSSLTNISIDGFSLGFGLKLGRSSLIDYSFTPHADFGPTHTFSLGARF